MKNKRLIQEVNAILGNVSVALGADRSTFFMLNKKTFALESVVAQGVNDISISVPYGKGIVGAMLLQEKALIVNDVQNNPLFYTIYDTKLNYTTLSTICVPVFNSNGKIIGAIQCLNRIEDKFQENDIAILHGFAATISSIVKNKELYVASEQIKNNFSHLLDIFAAISSELDLENLIQLIMTKASEITKADRSSLFLIDEETGELWTSYAKGLEKEVVRTKTGIVAEVAKSKQALIVNDPYNHPTFNAGIDLKTGYKTESILCVPVFNADTHIIGVIQVINKIEGVFDTKDLAILKGFASQISIAIQNATLFDEVYNMKHYLDILVENLDNGIVTVDKLCEIKTVSHIFYEIFALDKNDDLCQKSINDLDKNLQSLFKFCKQTIKTGKKHYQHEIELLTKNAKKVIVNLSVLPMQDANGEIIGAINVFQDVTKEKRIRTNLSRYIPNHLVNEVMNKEELSMLKGKYDTCSILFSDIRNFTMLTEELGAIQIVELLNTYFGSMISSVYKHKGILDKFIGDAIMAVFGVPYKNRKDAVNAVKCAFDMFAMLEELNVKNNKLPILNIGIGISTGNVVSGNIGSEKRFEYTVIGDSVNLAARLESATKIYKVNMLICETTYKNIKSEFYCREIDTVSVKGKQKPVKIYTVIGPKSKVLSKNQLVFNNYYAQGLKMYRKGDFDKAYSYFLLASKIDTYDEPTRVFIERCSGKMVCK